MACKQLIQVVPEKLAEMIGQLDFIYLQHLLISPHKRAIFIGRYQLNPATQHHIGGIAKSLTSCSLGKCFRFQRFAFDIRIYDDKLIVPPGIGLRIQA